MFIIICNTKCKPENNLKIKFACPGAESTEPQSFGTTSWVFHSCVSQVLFSSYFSSITDSMDMSSSKFWETVKDSEACCCCLQVTSAVSDSAQTHRQQPTRPLWFTTHEVAKSRPWLSNWTIPISPKSLSPTQLHPCPLETWRWFTLGLLEDPGVCRTQERMAGGSEGKELFRLLPGLNRKQASGAW